MHDAVQARFSAYAAEVIAPALWGLRHPLGVAVHQCADPIPHARAVEQTYTPVAPGFRWGPVWSTAWFHVTGNVPSALDGRRVALRFDDATEALLWKDGRSVRGFDRNRDDVLLFDAAAAGTAVDVHIEAACNHALGATRFWWDPEAMGEQWASDTPGCLRRCELAEPRPEVWRLWTAFEFARGLHAELAPTDPRRHVLAAALEDVVRRLDDRDVPACATETAEHLERALGAGAAPSATRCVAVGHAHIDTAWLWPIRETRRKCVRTFRNVLDLMDRFEDFRFVASQAQQYAWLEDDDPELFAAITDRVRDGRWEAGGAMWIEPDANVPSGESLVRQLLYGCRYWSSRFGDDAPQRYLYLPDTFGFPASLPQIMAGAGLDTFITNKMSWSESNRFPHVSFRWRGIDGTEVLSHFTPGHDYNSDLAPSVLRRGERHVAELDARRVDVWLQPYGYGDGGGGPTAEMIRRADLAADAEGLPRVSLGGIDAFCGALHDARDEHRRARGEDLPVWDGELYLELHRGTLTTQSWLKTANARAEIDLRRAEWLRLARPGAGAVAPELVAALDDAWRTVLLHQFHDILPGSSIPMVYDDARAAFTRLDEQLDAINADARAPWLEAVGPRAPRAVHVAFNPSPHAATGVVDCGDRLEYVRDVPAFGVQVIDDDAPAPPPVTASDRLLDNGIVRAEIDDDGAVKSLTHRGVELASSDAPLNELTLYEDRPRAWEAWDIDREHVHKRLTLGSATVTLIEHGALRGVIETRRPIGAESMITQRYVLHAGSPRLDVETHVIWEERHRLLRALFPTRVRARRATCGIQFGHLERDTHRNTSWDEARFEVCAHGWVDVSQPDRGLAVLTHGKYGHALLDGGLGLTLLRGPTFPDPDADRGEHRFTYALLPHGGDWRAAGVDQEARRLAAPLEVVERGPEMPSSERDAWAPWTLEGEGADGVEVTAIKPGTSDDTLILRLVETRGCEARVEIEWAWPVNGVTEVDLLERAVESPAVTHNGETTLVEFTPFKIRTLALRLTR